MDDFLFDNIIYRHMEIGMDRAHLKRSALLGGIAVIMVICTLFVIPMIRLFYVQLFNFFHAKTTNERFGRMGQFNQ